MIAQMPETLVSGAARPAAKPSRGAKPVRCDIVHQVDGRVRLRIPRLAYDDKFARRLVESVAALPGVTSVRVNASSSSLVVSYHRGQIEARRNGHGPGASSSILSDLTEAIRVSAEADVVGNLVPAPARDSGESVNYVQALGLPALGIGLSAAMLAGLAIPPALVGGTVLAATAPHLLRAVRGLSEEKQLTVEWLDVTAVVLLVSQGSFLAPAFMMGVIEGAEVVRSWTAQRSQKATQQLLKNHPVACEAAAASPPGGPAQQTGAAEFAGPANGHSGDNGYNPDAAAALALRDAAPRHDTRVSNYARKTGNWSVVPTLLVAGAVGAASGSVGRATGIVSMDMGLGMRVSTPVAILAAQAHAARHGILIGSGRALEMLAQADTILLDVSDSNLPDGADAGVISNLGDMDKDVFLWVGNSRSGTDSIAARLGIPAGHVSAGLRPGQKAEFVKELQAGGKTVAVFGHSAGATAGMAYADVSITFGNASAEARETAGILLANDDLRDLPVAMDIARQTMQLVRQNQALVVASSTSAITYATVAVLSPIAGVLLNNGVALVGALNSLRPLAWQGPQTQHSPDQTSFRR